jgi:salicylate hydroxylase
VLGRPFTPQETGDLAYRGTFTREQLEAFNDEGIDKLIQASNVQVWLGPNQHAVFYPLRNHTEFNLVLLWVDSIGVHNGGWRPSSCADDMAEGVRTEAGSVEEMAAKFEGWDPR